MTVNKVMEQLKKQKNSCKSNTSNTILWQLEPNIMTVESKLKESSIKFEYKQNESLKSNNTIRTK